MLQWKRVCRFRAKGDLRIKYLRKQNIVSFVNGDGNNGHMMACGSRLSRPNI
jgi:hypothetical protein